MLTAFQAQVIAYIGDGDLYCVECVEAAVEAARAEGRPRAELPEDFAEYADPEGLDADAEAFLGYSAVIRYTLETDFPEGAWCGQCGVELVEPDPDYCHVHDGWRQGDSDRCDYARGEGECRFPAAEPPSRI